MFVAEDVHVRHTSCSSKIATLGSEKSAQTSDCSAQTTVHVIIAGSGDDLEWRSQKLNEKLELVQNARLGRGHDRSTTVLNRCVTYSDSGLTWEADPRHAELAVATDEPWPPLDHEELELDGQKAYHSVSARLAYLAADRLTLHSRARSAVGQSGKQRVQNTHVGSESDDTCCTHQELKEKTRSSGLRSDDEASECCVHCCSSNTSVDGRIQHQS